MRAGGVQLAEGLVQLAEGLMLVRASTLKMIRLQLAIERHDRHAALEAVDDLVALDRQLEDCLQPIPGTRDQLALRRSMDADRFALNREKLVLAAEILRRPADPVRESGAVEEAASVEREDAWLAPSTFEPATIRWWLVIAPLLLLCVAIAAYFSGMPDAAAWLDKLVGALR